MCLLIKKREREREEKEICNECELYTVERVVTYENIFNLFK